MATMSLLEMVQTTLSRLGSDEVNSISDTVESMQVARIYQNKYLDIVARGAVQEQKQLYQLTPSGDASKPTLMYIPASVNSMDWIKYFDSNPADSQQVSQFGAFSHGLNTDLVSSSSFITTSSTSNTIGTGSKTFTVASSGLSIFTGQGVMAISGTNSMTGTVTSYAGTTLVINVTSFVGSGTLSSWTVTNSDAESVPGYKYVTQLPIDQFLDMINRFNPADNDVGSFTFTEASNNYTFYYKNDIQPKYCTVIANHFVIFDSYDVDFDSTLQTSKTMCFGSVMPTFSMIDSFIPPFDDVWFPLMINEATSLAFFELKQMMHPKADQEIKRQWAVVQKKAKVSDKPSDFDALANYGRVPRTGGYSSGGYGAYKWMRQAGP